MDEATAYWTAGARARSTDVVDVVHPYDGRVVARACRADDADVERAVAAAHACREEAAALPAHVRAAALDHVSRRLLERAEDIAQQMTLESGKPLKWSRAEVPRAAETFRFAAEEARRWSGEVQRLDTDARSAGRLGLTRRVPRGPVLGITPFNFPLNLVAHKMAPALAVGAPVVLKPAPRTPLTALVLGELLAETDLPAGTWSVLPMTDAQAARLVADPRLPVVSFTGSGAVGWRIRDSAPRKHMTLELGSNAAALVCADYTTDADLDLAADRIATFAMYQAGQSCISVQRVYATANVYGPLAERVVQRVAALNVGDPFDPDTDVGPLIDEPAAERVEQWVGDAVSAGARILVGGKRDRTTYAPTVLENVPGDAMVHTEEVFGPVVVLSSVQSDEDGFDRVNDSRYGLQAGVFTHDLHTAFRAFQRLEVGGVIVGDVPSYRTDNLAYGGVKDSGDGREGIRSAMADYTQERVLVLTEVTL
jgi:acyl-CoA reductase-like NAD-dependent aldehyde dehydrogenase